MTGTTIRSDASDGERAEDLAKMVWERWFAMDFSWEGLAKPHLIGKRDVKRWRGQPLQHYWLTDPATGALRTYDDLVKAGEIVQSPGQPDYHIAHLPPYYDLARSMPTARRLDPEFDQRQGRVLLRRLLAPVTDDEWVQLQFQGSVLDSEAFNVEDDGGSIDYEQRRKALRQSMLNLNDAVVLSDFDWELDEKNRFDAARTSCLGGLSVEVKGEGDLFLTHVYAERLSLSGDTKGHVFIGGLIATSGVNLYNCKIDAVHFGASDIYGNADFSEARISRLYISNVTFYDDADFSRFSCDEEVSLSHCRFRSDADFSALRAGDANFRTVEFDQSVTFSAAEFGFFRFDGVEWPKNAADSHAAFSRASFREIADFSGSGFRAFAAFDGAWFQRGVRFDRVGEGVAQTTFARELYAAVQTWRDGEHDTVARLLGSMGIFTGSVAAQRDAVLECLESGCRTLKQAMGVSADKSMEQLFYRFEVRARRKQSKTAMAEKVISWIYLAMSNYGASYLRPMTWLVAVWLGFACLYWPLSTVQGQAAWPATGTLAQGRFPDPGGWQVEISRERMDDVLSASASRIFPFGAFESTSKEFADAARTKNRRAELLFHGLGTLESFMALTLAFMFGLAVRRRFQID